MDGQKSSWYEFEIGVYIEADTENDALRILSPLIEAAEKLDPEGDVAVEMCGTHPYGGPVFDIVQPKKGKRWLKRT